MKSKEIQFLGLDFGSKFSYITYMTADESFPCRYSSVSKDYRIRENDGDGYPTVMAYDSEHKKWKIGLKSLLDDFAKGTFCGCIYSRFKYFNGSANLIRSENSKKVENELAKDIAVRYFEKLLALRPEQEFLDNENEHYEESKNHISVFKKSETSTDGRTLSRQEYLDVSAPQRICVGYPRLYAGDYSEAIGNAVREAYKNIYKKELGDKLVMQPEPYLAAVAYANLNREKLKENCNILLIDLGGYTMDLIVFQIDSKGKVVVNNEYNTLSFDHRTEDIINKIIFDAVNRNAAPNVASESEKETSIEIAKRELFKTGQATTIKLHDNILNGSNRITLCYGESDVGGGINLYHNGNDDIFAREYIDKFNVLNSLLPPKCKVGQVIFTGGASNIEPLVRCILDSLYNEGRLEDDFFVGNHKLMASKIKDDEFMKSVTGRVLFMNDSNQPKEKANKSNVKPDKLTCSSAVAYGACLVAANPDLEYKDKNIMWKKRRNETDEFMSATNAFEDSVYNISFKEIAANLNRKPKED